MSAPDLVAAHGAYRREPLTLALTGDFDGLVLECRRPSVGQILGLDERITAAGGAGAFEAMRGIAEILAGAGGSRPVITAWNLADGDDGPVPITVETLLDLDVDMLLAITVEVVGAVRGVPAPLGGTSGSGEPSPGPNAEMEASLASLQSSLAPVSS